MYDQEQMKLALAVLKKMKACIDADTTFIVYGGESFNLHKTFGICWHLYSSTSNESHINMDFLYPVFKEMGLNERYPVETLLGIEWSLPINDKYDLSTECGKVRYKLINDLIQYFTDKIYL